MEYPEPKGCYNRPTFVKNNPLNNDSYLEQSCELFPEWADILRNTHQQLNELVPGYNIAQIKEKFFELRFYVDLPEDASSENKDKAWEVLRQAENSAPSLH